MSNINDTYFDGYYKQIWKSIIPEELTPKEVDFIIQYFKLQPGSSVLDMMCGYGRHGLALAEKGIKVTAVDNLPDYIYELREKSEEKVLPVKAELYDIMKYEASQKFDVIICMGNSLQFFEKKDLRKLLRNISDYLKPKGHFLINSWSILEIVLKNFKDRSWSTIGDLKFLVENRYLFSPSRIETEHQIIAPDGTTEIKQSIDYIWSLNEIEEMLQESDMHMTEVFSIPGRKKFTWGEPRAYIIAEKV
jgi:2-polyprenyl-3-methyl-5-hydroxy-6-metoxy-1,4-benzoquinol methylase